MDEPLMTLKPHVINALLPVFLGVLLKVGLVGLAIVALFWIMNVLGWLVFDLLTGVVWSILIIVFVSLIPLTWRIIVLWNTKYYFFEDRVVYEFEFISVETHSVPYHKVTDVSVHMTLWDRICGAGDIILRTGDDSLPDLKLMYIQKPGEVVQKIHDLVAKNTHVIDVPRRRAESLAGRK